MNIHIDLLHPAHINLFKSLINKGSQEHNFIITCIDRGKVPKIAREEIKSVKIHVIGKHRGTKLSIIFQANVLRFFQLFWFLRNKKIDVGLSFGSFLSGAIVRLKGKPFIHLNDDPERKINAFLENITCTERYLPPIVKEKRKVKVFNALKEWAYLSPDYFTPKEDILSKYNVSPKNYIFIREVSTGSLNYMSQDKNLIAAFADKMPKSLPVILSLEDKTTKNQYPDYWTILEEPVNDIHSIIFYSSLVISSGDSMAREGAILGVPSIYCGFREMKANQILMDKNILFKLLPDETIVFINDFFQNKLNSFNQEEFRAKLKNEWVDINAFLLEILLKNKKY